MRGEQYLNKPEQYATVYDNGASSVDKLVVIKTISNGLGITRYGFSVSSRVGGAVKRNLIKRRLREILRRLPLESGWDIVIIARPAAAKVEFKSLKSSVCNLLIKAQILKQSRYVDS